MSAVTGTEEYIQKIARIQIKLDKNPDVKLLKPEEFVAMRDYLLVQWNLAKEQLDAAKAKEMEMRTKCVAFMFDPNKKKGTERVELGNGYEAKAVKKLNYNFIKNSDGKLDKVAVDNALTEIEHSGPEGAYIADNLVKWEPTLSLTEYGKLDPNRKAIIDKVIVTSDGAPTLEIIPPKGKK